jgi:F0F1-type ATP synthase assembly protein I
MGFLEKTEKKVKEQKKSVRKKKRTELFSKFKTIFKRKKKDKKEKVKEEKKKEKEKPKKESKKDKKSEKKNKLPPLKKVLNIVFTFIIIGSVIIYILHRKEILIFNKWVWTIIGFMLLTSILFVLNIMLQKWMKERRKTIIKHIASSDKNEYKTDIDILFDFIKMNKKADLDIVAKEFSINREKAEEWAKILESSELITIHYPAFGDAQLVYKETTEEKEKKKREAKKEDGKRGEEKKRD